MAIADPMKTAATESDHDSGGERHIDLTRGLRPRDPESLGGGLPGSDQVWIGRHCPESVRAVP
jgi:hypothetical protein